MNPKIFIPIWLILVTLVGCTQIQTSCQLNERELTDRARSLIISYTYSESPVLRSHAIESLAEAKQVSAASFILEGLNDDYWGVRFTACMAIMQLQIDQAKPRLRKRIKDKNKSVRAAAAGSWCSPV